MSNLTTFEIIAGMASILGLLFVLGSSTYKLWRTFKKKRENAEQELKRELDRLQAAGGTVSARTDLGFFVLIELGALRNSIAHYQHHRTTFFVFAVLIFILRNFIVGNEPEVILESYVLFLFVCILLVTALFVHVLVMRLEKYTESYERRIKEVWQRPIDKRITHKDNSGN